MGILQMKSFLEENAMVGDNKTTKIKKKTEHRYRFLLLIFAYIESGSMHSTATRRNYKKCSKYIWYPSIIEPAECSTKFDANLKT